MRKKSLLEAKSWSPVSGKQSQLSKKTNLFMIDNKSALFAVKWDLF